MLRTLHTWYTRTGIPTDWPSSMHTRGCVAKTCVFTSISGYSSYWTCTHILDYMLGCVREASSSLCPALNLWAGKISAGNKPPCSICQIFHIASLKWETFERIGIHHQSRYSISVHIMINSLDILELLFVIIEKLLIHHGFATHIGTVQHLCSIIFEVHDIIQCYKWFLCYKGDLQYNAHLF